MIRYAIVAALALSVVACSSNQRQTPPQGDYKAFTPGQVIVISEMPYDDEQHPEENIPEKAPESPAPDQMQAPDIPANAQALDPDILYEMGRQAIEGDGVAQSMEIGKYYLGLSNELGNVEAKRVLAVLDLRENPEDTLAQASLEEAAQTSVKAKAQYGIMLSNLSLPHLNNLERGISYLNEADAAGSHEAAFALYQLNKTKEPKQAQEWLLKAANLGNPNAIKYLAHSMAYHQNKNESLKWILAARNLNDPQATYDYANSLIIGRYQPVLSGYKRSREFEAYYWFQKSAAQGHEQSAAEINNLRGVAMEMSAASITLDDIARDLGLEG
jgi:TPR repeat protein